jgi:spore coat protein I
MLEYPEKFWKIIDHYYNSKKSLMSDRNSDKLEKLIKQEKNKEKLINKLF